MTNLGFIDNNVIIYYVVLFLTKDSDGLQYEGTHKDKIIFSYRKNNDTPDNEFYRIDQN